MLEIVVALPLVSIYLLYRLSLHRNPAAKYGAPFVALEDNVVAAVIRLADIRPGETFYDLGSGDGRLVIAAALQGAIAYGIEIDPLRVWYSRICIFLFGLGRRATIIQRNIFDVDLSRADVITAYLLPETNLLLQPKLKKEIKKSARVIGIAFPFPQWHPDAIDSHGPVYGPLYVYESKSDLRRITKGSPKTARHPKRISP